MLIRHGALFHLDCLFLPDGMVTMADTVFLGYNLEEAGLGIPGYELRNKYTGTEITVVCITGRGRDSRKGLQEGASVAELAPRLKLSWYACIGIGIGRTVVYDCERGHQQRRGLLLCWSSLGSKGQEHFGRCWWFMSGVVVGIR